MSYNIDDGTPLSFIFLVFLQKDEVIRWETINRTAGKCKKHLPSMRSKALKLAIRSCQTQRIPYYGNFARLILHRRNSPPFVTSVTYTRGLDRA